MWGHELHDDVKKALDSTGHYRTVEKNTFGSLNLIDYEIIESVDFDHNVTLPFGTKGGELEIHICGVCTSICVLANAVLIRAKYPDAKIVSETLGKLKSYDKRARSLASKGFTDKASEIRKKSSEAMEKIFSMIERT